MSYPIDVMTFYLHDAVVTDPEHDEAWTTISPHEVEGHLPDGMVRYEIDYEEVFSLADAGKAVRISLDHVSEGAVRNAATRWGQMTGTFFRCRLTSDHRHIIVTRLH